MRMLVLQPNLQPPKHTHRHTLCTAVPESPCKAFAYLGLFGTLLHCELPLPQPPCSQALKPSTSRILLLLAASLGMMSLMNLTGLASLNISGCVAITDIGIMMVAQLTGLTSLEMAWCLKLTNIGLSALTPLTKLSNLNISGCQLITEQGIACLGTFTNLCKLGLLNLGYSKVCVTDAALQRLSSLTKLESLNIGLNIGTMQPLHKAVTDSSMGLISSRFRELTQLGLMSLDISDDGVKCLSQLSKLQVRWGAACGCRSAEEGSAPTVVLHTCALVSARALRSCVCALSHCRLKISSHLPFCWCLYSCAHTTAACTDPHIAAVVLLLLYCLLCVPPINRRSTCEAAPGSLAPACSTCHA